LSFYKRYRDTFLVVLLLAVPFFFLRASIRKPEELNAVDRVLVRIAARVHWAAACAARFLSNAAGEYFYLVDVGRDNNRLSREVSRLQQTTREIAALKRENERLRKLLGLRDTVPVETVSASVTTKTPTEFFRVAHVVVDHNGAALRENMPVIAADGAVGLIKRVHGDSATVFLLADAGFGVDVVVPRTEARGYVRGTGDESSYTVKVSMRAAPMKLRWAMCS
jgi:rod shape-determining protein MreC